MIVALEGIDNAGKTYYAEAISQYFKHKGREVFVSKELTTEIGQQIEKKDYTV